MKHINKLFENGRTMLEVLAALAILASIGVGISAGINHGLMVYRSSVLQTQLPQLKKAIQTVYAFENYDYSNVENRDDYSELFENILDDNACTGNICKSAGGSFKISSVNGGRGFKITFIEMPKGICLELADAIRNDRSSTVKQGFIMANSCNTDNKQIVEFVNAESFEDNKCPGRQFWNGTSCTCFNENAFGEECELPTLDPVIPPATTTTTTKAEIYYSSDNGNDQEPEQTEVTATYEILYSSAADAFMGTTTQVYKTETETPTYTMAMTTNVETQTPTMATFATETTVETTLPPHTSDMSLTTTDQITMTSGYNYGDGNDGKTTTNIPATTGGMSATTATRTPETTTPYGVTETQTPTTTATRMIATTETQTPTTTVTATRTPETTTPYGVTATQTPTTTATATRMTTTATQTPTTTATATRTLETTTPYGVTATQTPTTTYTTTPTTSYTTTATATPTLPTTTPTTSTPYTITSMPDTTTETTTPYGVTATQTPTTTYMTTMTETTTSSK